MKNFFHTRDGQGNVVVSTESLKRKFNNLYFEQPLNPSQIFSNSFVLTMASERFKALKTLRECELGAGKHEYTALKRASLEVQLLMHRPWTPY